MKAAVLREVGAPLVIEDVVARKPGPREVLIRTTAAGLCHSDLHIMDGTIPFPMPIVLGHESAGVVEQVGEDVRRIKVGDHVVTCLSVFCGHCAECLTGHLNRCADLDVKAPPAVPRLSTANGEMAQFANLSSFAEHMLVDEHACVTIRRDMPMDRAALIGCSVLTGCGAVFHTADVRPGATVAVIGCGGVGLAAINGAAIAGARRIVAVDVSPAKEAMARQFGATDFVNGAQTDAVAIVKDMTDGGVDFSFEAVGLPQTIEQAFEILRPGGAATVIGVARPGLKVSLQAIDLLSEKKLQGSMMGSNRFPVDIPRLIDMYMAGNLKLDEMISQRIRLEQINKGFADMKTGKIARSVIMFDG